MQLQRNGKSNEQGKMERCTRHRTRGRAQQEVGWTGCAAQATSVSKSTNSEDGADSEVREKAAPRPERPARAGKEDL